MTLQERYIHALRRIAYHEVDGPVNEWSEAEAYGELQDIALEALEPGTLAARAKAHQEALRRDKDRSRELRKESSAGKRHFYNDCAGVSGAIVCVLNHGCAEPHLVEVKVVEIVGGWSYRRVGDRFFTNVGNLYESQETAYAKFHPKASA